MSKNSMKVFKSIMNGKIKRPADDRTRLTALRVVVNANSVISLKNFAMLSLKVTDKLPWADTGGGVYP